MYNGRIHITYMYSDKAERANSDIFDVPFTQRFNGLSETITKQSANGVTWHVGKAWSIAIVIACHPGLTTTWCI